jgi:hypothetical protein
MARPEYDSSRKKDERSGWETFHPETATALADSRRTPEATGHRGRYQARWISKAQISNLRRTGGLSRAVLVDYRTGFVIVEPVGSNLGDGEVLPLDLADYELHEVWCPTPRAKLVQARKLLGLDGTP